MSEIEFREFIGNPNNIREYPSATVRASIHPEELVLNERNDKNGYLISRFLPVNTKLKDEVSSDDSAHPMGKINVSDEMTIRAIKTRRGQPAFRPALLAAFNGACCITGCKVEAILEAAHIIPHGDETNYSVHNGLLLRADVHTLFDLDLLRISKAGIINVHKSLKIVNTFNMMVIGLWKMYCPINWFTT